MRFAKFATSLEQSQDKVVIAGAGCHCGRRLSLRAPAVIADSIRNPVVGWHWIPDQVRDDKLGGRDDKLGVWDDKCRSGLNFTALI